MTAEQRLQNDIENICEMAMDDIKAALWHYGVNQGAAAEELERAIGSLQTAIALIKG